MKLPLALALAIGLMAAPYAYASGIVPPAEKTTFEASLKEVIKEAASGKIADVDGAIAKMDKAIAQGVVWCKAHAAKDAANAKALEFIAGAADKMKAETLESIETNYHQGKAMKDAGAGDYAKIDQTSATAALLDTIIHPATAHIALSNFKKDGKKEHLDQVVSELEELVGHLSHL